MIVALVQTQAECQKRLAQYQHIYGVCPVGPKTLAYMHCDAYQSKGQPHEEPGWYEIQGKHHSTQFPIEQEATEQKGPRPISVLIVSLSQAVCMEQADTHCEATAHTYGNQFSCRSPIGVTR